MASREDAVVLTWNVDSRLRVPFRVDERVEDGLRTFRVRFWHVPIPKLDGVAKLAGCLRVLATLRRSGWAPDVIHAHEFEAGRLALVLGHVRRVPVVVSEHWSGFARGEADGAARARARHVFERAAAVCPVSLDLERRLRLLAPRARFETVPNPVDTTVFRPEPRDRRPRDPLRLITVGSLVEVKGHRYLLEAVEQVSRSRPVSLDVIGDGPLRKKLTDHVTSLGLSRLVTLHGALPHPAIAAHLRQSDIFVLASLWENMPCALIEALASGVPAVATRVGGVPEVLETGRGVLVEPRSAPALAEGILEAAGLLDGHDASRLAARAAETYGFDAVGARWSGVYAGVLRECA